MGRKATVEKNRVYIECDAAKKRVKAVILSKSEKNITVELPTGVVLELIKRHRKGNYILQIGMLEFACDGRLVV